MKNISKHLTYIDNATGSGKTKYMVGQINTLNEKFLIVTPSRSLCDEINSQVTRKSIVIHSTHTETPSNDLKYNIESGKHDVIVTTQASFFNSFRKGLKNINEWNVVFDEDFSLYNEHTIWYSKNTRALIKKYFGFKKDGDLHQITEKDTALHDIINSGNEETFISNDSFKRITQCVVSPNINIFCTDVYRKSLDDKFDNDTDVRKLHMVSMIDIEYLMKFKSVMILSSFFTKSITYKIFKHLGLSMVGQSLSAETASKQKKVKIKYYTNRNWSTTYRRSIKDGMKIEDIVYQNIREELYGKSFIYNTNISYRDKISGGTLVTTTHGVNSYMHYNNILYLPSLNATNDLVNFLKSYGVSRSDIDYSRNVLSAYQFVSRGAVRDPNYEGEINIYVADKRTADFLNDAYDGSMVEFISLFPPKVKIPANIRSFVSRTKKRLENNEKLRKSTLDKYKRIIKEYYD